MKPIKKILIANRGEIACRIIRTARRLGIGTVAVYSDADAGALHVALADQAARLGPAPAAESYLRGERIIEAALAAGADTVHPGYGFVSENPGFAEAVEAAGLVFIGPSASAIRAMGLKDRAKALMEKAGVPVVPGYHGEAQEPKLLAKEAERIGYPVLIKARAGGGGKGMRRVDAAKEFKPALEAAQREAEASFGDPACLIEKYIEHPRHIEVQIFGDRHGEVVHLFERDCSLQRRHQKVIEEAPAPGMTAELRAAMGSAAVAAAKAVSYVGAGTVEFIVDGARYPDSSAFWFMEMNTRLQVEHPVTEAITGVDLVALQIAVAEGAPLPFSQADLAIDGHAVEARLYAEDAAAGFLPATGTLERLVFPTEQGGVRVDAGVRQGDAVTPYYDPMIAKIIAHGPDRAGALRRLRSALAETIVSGSVANRGFLLRLIGDEDVAAGRIDTGLIERKQAALAAERAPEAIDYALAALAALAPAQGEAFANFRLFGPARQSVVFEGAEPGETLVVAVESEGGARRVETPLGPVELCEARPDGARLRFVSGGIAGEAIAGKIDERILVQREGAAIEFALHRPGGGAEEISADAILAPMPGLVRRVGAKAGGKVEKGETLIVLEAMKMEHALAAPRSGVVAEVLAREGLQVEQGAVLLMLVEEA